ncbi:glycosyltransferase [Oscillospiraceae bacterium OttesenSCG-928-G22]|nr:glycosyltransferase [Oscillospiraceae bacterium OttesenSCG-928-G22]
MKKVLQMPVANAKGGITNYALQNWKHIDHTRFRFDFVTRSPSLDFAPVVEAEGCKIHYLSCSSSEDEPRFIREMNAILDEGYDAVHLHTSYWNGMLVEKLAMARKIPVVIVHAHNTDVLAENETERAVRLRAHEAMKAEFSTEDATHFCACSQLAADWLFGPQIPKENILILNNAVDTAHFAYNPKIRQSLRAGFELEGKFTLGHVGRFVHQKNHTFLLEAFAEARKIREDLHLLLVGDGPLLDDAKEQGRSLGLGNSVTFLGRRNDVSDLMQAMDLFVLPSHYEGLGLVLIEAQVSGLRCLASDAVPSESKVTPLLNYLPLELPRWRDAILVAADGYDRCGCSAEVAAAGYDLKNQIKVLEALYEGRL